MDKVLVVADIILVFSGILVLLMVGLAIYWAYVYFKTPTPNNFAFSQVG